MPPFTLGEIAQEQGLEVPPTGGASAGDPFQQNRANPVRPQLPENLRRVGQKKPSFWSRLNPFRRRRQEEPQSAWPANEQQNTTPRMVRRQPSGQRPTVTPGPYYRPQVAKQPVLRNPQPNQPPTREPSPTTQPRTFDPLPVLPQRDDVIAGGKAPGADSESFNPFRDEGPEIATTEDLTLDSETPTDPEGPTLDEENPFVGGDPGEPSIAADGPELEFGPDGPELEFGADGETVVDSEPLGDESPFSGKLLEGEMLPEEPEFNQVAETPGQAKQRNDKLPKLKPVPSYFNMEKLADTNPVDSEAMRREKLRLMLRARPGVSGLKGFCIVTLKDDRDLVDGKPEFYSEFDSRIFTFSSMGAKRAFDAAPHQYAPANGGNDVVLRTRGETRVEGSLDHAAWYRGKLYLFSSEKTHAQFVKAPREFAGPRILR